MKIFYNGRCISATGKGKKIQGLTNGQPKMLIARYRFNNTLYDLIPDFNTEFTNYTYEDIVNGEVTTRSIYSDSLPTLMRFGMIGDDVHGETPVKHLCLLEISYINCKNLTTCASMFRRCKNLTKINNINITNSVTETYDMFAECSSLLELDVSNFDTSNVTDMHGMFCVCWNLSTIIGLNNLDVHKVNIMHNLFNECVSLLDLDLSNWDVNNVLDFRHLFINCHNLKRINLSNWKMSDMIDYTNILMNCYNLNNVIMNSSDYNSVNTIITSLPTRTADDPGTLDITGIDDISKVDIPNINNKCWNITSHTILNNAILGKTKLN